MSATASHTLEQAADRVPTRIQDCYQCGKCSAGCPRASHMDVLPHQLLRLMQLGHTVRAARSEAIWQCVSCQTCTARCPQSVDCAGVMDHLREQAVRQKMAARRQRRTWLFQQAFLRNIRRNGRLDELELIAAFKTSAFLRDLDVPALFKDSLLAPKLMRRRKFHWRGEKVRDRAVVRRIFDRCQPAST